MDRKARGLMYLGFFVINMFLFKGVGIHALGLLFLVFGIYTLATKPRPA